MKIALLGYGKMGQTIEKLAINRGYEIVLRVTIENRDSLRPEDLKQADVAIEFSQPDAAVRNMLFCFESGVPVVCGTTGWYERMQDVRKAVDYYKGTLFYASNFSIGVNIFIEVSNRLAEMMNRQPQYDNVFIHETHHVHKLDAPSGTAITIAEQMISRLDRYKSWTGYKYDESIVPSGVNDESLPVFSTREDEVNGTHIVKYKSDVDELEIIHKAFSRIGFAEGAIAAAEFIHGRKGVFTMSDLLKL